MTGPRTLGDSVKRGFPAGDSDPTIVQRNRLGIAIINTASNAPTIAAITTVAASATAPSSSCADVAARARIHAPTSSANSAREYNATATNPRSAVNATQSLLGHGFDVMPSSLSDGSFFDA